MNSTDNRIAKNTLMLYSRTFVVMLVSLYTSRLVLNALGVVDFGIYSVIGGIVGLFSAITNSLSFSITRFITYEVGKGDPQVINRVFCVSYNLIIPICLFVFLLGEIGGAWFIFHKLNIPESRCVSAIWALNALLFSLCFGLLNAPYNALIIAYEKMSVFAYISIFEALLKLVVCFCIIVAPYDKLIIYSILMAVVSIILRFVYRIYCKRHFEASSFHFKKDKQLTINIAKYAGLCSTTHFIFSLNTQGITILLNLFFGVVLNAARGIAFQIQSIITTLVSNITAAITPQITKTYALGEYKRTGELVCNGIRYVYLLLLLISVPLFFETETILGLWLGSVPDHTVSFVRLTIVCSLIDRLGDTVRSAIMASEQIKKFTLYINFLTLLIFPLTWIVFFLGYKPEMYYVIFFLMYMFVNIKQLYILKNTIQFPLRIVFRNVLLRICLCTSISVILPFFIVQNFPPSIMRLAISLTLGVVWSAICAFFIALTHNERGWIVSKVINYSK